MSESQVNDLSPSAPCLAVIVPIFNEEATLRPLLRAVLDQPLVREVVCVDDCSSDRSYQILSEIAASDQRVRIFRHEENAGKGAAVRTAINEVMAPLVIIQDADLEYDPAEYPRLVQPIISGRADVVFGSRFLGSEAHRVLYFWHSVGNRFLTLLSNMFTNLNLTDMEVCYKAFKSEILKMISLEERGFGIEPEIVAKISRLDLRIYEVAISYHGRTYAEGKKIGWRDGISAIRCIIKYGLTPRATTDGKGCPPCR